MTISTTEERQFVVFDLGNESFGIDIAVVKEIIQKTDSTKLPEMDEFIDGIINVRGDVIPIISLGRKFKLYDSVTEDQETKVIIVELKAPWLVWQLTQLKKFYEFRNEYSASDSYRWN